MPVPVLFKGQGKDSTLIFNHTSSGQSFDVNLPFAVDSILIDPNLYILSAHNKVMEESAYLRSLESFVIYPNPALDIITIEINNFSAFPRSIALYNVLGQQVLTFIPQAHIFSIPLTNLASGSYYVKIISDGNVVTRKIVKE